MIDISRFAHRWRNMPVAVTVALVLLLLAAGVGVILQTEATYRQQKREETRVQAQILAASVKAAVDFGDRTAAQDAANALRVNRQIRAVSIYDRHGALLAGYRRDGAPLSPTLARSLEHTRDAGLFVADAAVASGGTVRVFAEPQPLETRLGRYLLIALLVIMAALVVAVLGIAQAVLRRANRELAERAAALAETNAELKVQIEERAKAEDQLRQAHKLQALGQLTGGIAHDFNNLLTVIQGSADMLARPELKEDKRRRYADAIVQASSRAAELTGQLLAFARRQPLRPEVLDMNGLVESMIELLDRTLGERITIETRLAEQPCLVEADRAQLTSAALNIAVNARDAMPDGGTLTVSTGVERGADGRDMVTLSVRDTGSGMDEETLARALEPFFTTKSAGKGTGLGLSQVYGFATQSGGELRIHSAPGQGTVVTILLPRTAREQLAAPDQDPAATAQGRTGAVLLVEDNDEVGEFAEVLLGELGHKVTRARSGEEALALVERQAFDIVFTDVVMPAMSGLELAERINAIRPGLPVVLTTGYSDEIAQSGAGGRPVILKPYRLDSLAKVLDEAMT